MTARSAYSFAIVCEAAKDKQIASRLAERVLVDEIDWMESSLLPSQCTWQGLDRTREFLTWAGAASQARKRRIRVHGRFRGEKGAFDARTARRALRLFKALEDSPDAVFLIRDTDGEQERLASLREVRDSDWDFPVVLGTPHPKVECWILAGFDPRNDKEQEMLQAARTSLGFDPRARAHRLTAKGVKGKRNAKKVLAQLSGGKSDREEACWRDADLEVLKERGVKSRLAAYLEDVSARIVPRLGGKSGSEEENPP